MIDDNGTILWDSNAILVYLVKRYGVDTGWLPEDPVKASEVQRWLSVAAGEIAPGPAAARLVHVFGAQLDHKAAVARAHALFKVMEPILERSAYLTGDGITIADVAGYSYIAHAPEGGVSLDQYPAIRAWLKRIESQPDFVAMASSPIPEPA